MGLPEPVSEINLGPLHRGFSKKILLLSTENSIQSAGAQAKAKRTNLGSQYVLGFIPLTRIYFEHGPQQLVTETALDELIAVGYETFIGNISSATELTKAIRPDKILSISLKDLRINAFDLFFLRKLSISGSLLYREHSLKNPLIIRKEYAIDLDDSKYQKYGLASDLSLFAERLLKNKFREAAEKLEEDKYEEFRSINKKQSSTKNILIVKKPQTKLLQTANIGSELALSYGDVNYPSYSSTGIERIVQRGLHAGSFNANTEVVSTSLRAISAGIAENSLWLDTEIAFLDIDQGEAQLELEIVYSIKTGSVKAGQELYSGTCKHQEKNRPQLDGSWVRTLEIASEKIAHAILHEAC